MSRYAETYKPSNLAGPGDARPTALQIIKDEGLTGKLSDKVFLVTGVSSGIGIETLRALHTTGAHVFGTVRNLPKGQKVVSDILSENHKTGGKITLLEIDTANLATVRAGAKAFLEQSDRLNAIIANAGIMAVPEGKTVDGFELQFGTNHLGHFLLFQLLKDVLLSSATPEYPSRYVSVSSKATQWGTVRTHDYGFEKEPYNEWAAYGQSKTANVWMSNYIERKFGAQNLHSTSLHPGGIMTGLGAHLDMADFDTPELRACLKSPAQGAATQVYAAVGQEWTHKGGVYLSDCAPARSYEEMEKEGLPKDWNDGYASWSYNPEGEEQLWKDSLKFVGLA
ncbi:NAD(P)-binding protein [Corynespora cassiicola Philippines]|uniref:NAD(P)-binding protein n=1 Tax=Corynespora cassiicola Philippines TaxID=1448308 RepID=A0A2T2NSG1_CORCC|nr:NAD(P)-binding protein [Corynespora cassiicola Philippines]